MKLYDFNPDNEQNVFFGTIESFDGSMVELKHDDVTKSFGNAKKEALKRLNSNLEDLKDAISTVESMTEEEVYNRERF